MGRRSRELPSSARRSRSPAAYRAALDLYGGELLPDDPYEEWAEARREALRQLYLALLIELAGLNQERGDYERAVETLRTLVAEEPTNEVAHAGLMRTLALSGRRRDALAQYERLREALSVLPGTEPGTITGRLRGEIALERYPTVQILPAGVSQEVRPQEGKQNLPAPRTSFVGREREMVEIERALAATRLLTFTGAGGSNKTRFALAENVQTGTLREEIPNLAPVNDDVRFFQRALCGKRASLSVPGQFWLYCI
jgi:DNA-binding SARP family transcriptional activator